MINRSVIAIILVALGQCLLIATQAFATPLAPLSVSSDDTWLPLTPHVSIYEDPSGELDAAQAANKIDQFAIIPEGQRFLKLGYRKGVTWVALKLTNNSPQAVRGYIGSVKEELKKFEVYFFRHSQLIQIMRSGTALPLANRAVPLTIPFVPGELPPHSSTLALLKVQSPYTLSLDLYWASEAEAFEQARFSFTLISFFVGGVSILFLYSLVLYWKLQDPIPLRYTCHAAILMLSIMNYTGSFFSYGLDRLGEFFAQTPFLFLFASSFTSIWYTRHFLQLDQHFPLLGKAFRLLQWTISLSLCVSLLLPIPYPVLGIAFETQALICVCLVLFAAILSIRSGLRYARLFALGWGGFVLSILLWQLGSNNVLPKVTFLTYAPLFGILLEVFMTTLSLLQRIRFLDDTKHAEILRRTKQRELKTLKLVLAEDIKKTIVDMQQASAALSDSKGTLDRSRDRLAKGLMKIEEEIRRVERLDCINRGQLELEIGALNVAALLSACHAELSALAHEKGVKLIFVPPDQPTLIYADNHCLMQDILIPIARNAIRHSSQGDSVYVVCENQPDEVQIIIKDFGVRSEDLAEIQFLFKEDEEDDPGIVTYGIPMARHLLRQFGARLAIEWKAQGEFATVSGTSICIHFPKVVLQRQAAVNASSIAS